nr:MAG TPA: hypothetical protein [Caudoviricetes sp.]
MCVNTIIQFLQILFVSHFLKLHLLSTLCAFHAYKYI